jgi:cytoskeleton protein RodZ
MASLGQSLREEREGRNISIEEIASATKIIPRYLEALEADRLDMMPGGFFVKGIIRTYARAIGLDPDEVLGRYKASGLLAGAEPGRSAAPRILPEPEAPMAQAPALPPVAAAEELGPSGPGSPAVENAPPELIIEEAPRPKLSAEARKRVLTWTLRGAGALLLIVILVVIWPSRRQRPPHVPPAGVAALAEPVSKSPTGSASEPAAAPASKAPAETSPKPEPPPVVEEIWTGVTIEISFQANTWIQVRADGEIKVNGIFPAGATARAQANEKLLLHTGNAGGFTFRLNGKPAKPLGRSGQVLTDIKITPENLKDFLEGQPTGPAAG